MEGCTMKLWIDNVRPAPEGYLWCKSVNEAKECIIDHEETLKCLNKKYDRVTKSDLDRYIEQIRRSIIFSTIELIDLDHDAGDYVSDGGDYIRLLDWLEETGRNYPIRIHSQNVVGIANMRAIIERNDWKEVK